MTRPNGSGQSIGNRRPSALAQKRALGVVIDLTEELDQRVVEKRHDVSLEILPVGVTVDEVELHGALEDLAQLEEVGSERIPDVE